MNQKKARELRKHDKVKYDPGEDPIKDRKYRYLTCVKMVVPGRKPRRERCGAMVVNVGSRLFYRQMKKAYKARKL